MDIYGIMVPILELIATGSIGFLSIIMVIARKRLSKWFTSVLWPKINRKTHTKLKIGDIENASKIREVLIELRILAHADRTSLSQFHNGSTFTTNNPIWKVSNTHESVAPGIASEIGRLQDIKASSIIETIKVLWGGEKPSGISEISTDYCQTKVNWDSAYTLEGHSCSCNEDEKKVIFIDVNKLEDSYSRSLNVEMGITYLIICPIYNIVNDCVGFVAVNYCGENDPEKIKHYCYTICRHTAQIQFLLLSQNN